MTEREEFENNKVLLWGEKKAKSSLLKEFDKGNKNPRSKKREPREIEVEEERPKVKAKVVRRFNLNEDYGVDDLPFLNEEYERIEKELDEGGDMELYDLQDKLYELIEGLEAMQKIRGNGIHYTEPEKKKILKEYALNEDIIGDDFVGASIKKSGRGFKKGSPEALAHAEKMRLAREAKKPKGEVVKKETKARVEKGSEEAKALARRLVEARKAKQEAKKKEEEEKKKKEEILNPTKPKGRPWYYIGDIPKGYREATELEAIKNNKVSKYGKYEVDETRLMLYRDYDILLDETKSLQEVIWTMNSLKKRIMESLQEIEIFENKLENPKYEKEHKTYKTKLTNEKIKRKYLTAGYNWYYKIYCDFKGIPYERQSFELPKREIKITKAKVNKAINPVQERPIDPRTGKPAEIDIPEEKSKKEEEYRDADVELYFENGDRIIKLSTKYFTQDYKLKKGYAKQLLDKNIVLSKKYYTTPDYEKYFFRMKGDGIRKFNLIYK